MGHVRLGNLPRTRKWAQVINLIASGACTRHIADATIVAAERGLRAAPADRGVVQSTWLLMHLPLAARADSFPDALRRLGLPVSEYPGLMELLGATADAIDARLPNNRGRTDLGEMAQTALCETLATVVGERTTGLFDSSPHDVERAIADLHTVKHFGYLTRRFTASFTFKCLDYFLSRTTANHIGAGLRFPTLARLSEFRTALDTHCQESAVIVERFAGDWRSKTRYHPGEITEANVTTFVGGAVNKLLDELKRRATDGN